MTTRKKVELIDPDPNPAPIDYDKIAYDLELLYQNPRTPLGIDTETTGLQVFDGRAHCIGISYAGLPKGEPVSGYLGFAHAVGEPAPAELVDMLAYVLEQQGRPLIIQNAQFDIQSLLTADVDIRGQEFYDLPTMANLIDENMPSKGMDAIAKKFAPHVSKLTEDEWLNNQKKIGWPLVTPERMYAYATNDAEVSFVSWCEMIEHKEWLALAPDYWGHKQKTILTLLEMRRRGVRLNHKAAQVMADIGNARMAELLEELGYSNLGPKALTELLLEKLQLPIIKRSAKTGNPSFDKEVMAEYDELLEKMDSDLGKVILEYRGWQKAVSAGYQAYLNVVSPDGRVRTEYTTHVTRTGRLSCVAPDTLIDMPRDMTKYPDGVPISEVKAGDWVYSFDMNMELTLRQVKWAGPTKVDKTIIVTFENSDGEQRKLQCTPDHLVRLYNGDWRHAAYLLKNYASTSRADGPRVLSMVRRSWHQPGKNDNYLTFFPHSNSRHTPPSVVEGARYGSSSGGKNKEHRWVMSQVLGKALSTKWDVNHIDGNKVNNHPSNLEYVSVSQHRKQTRIDGTYMKEQPWAEVFTGKNDFRAVSIEEGPVIEVWDMEVPIDHQFIANGIVIHNSKEPNLQQIPKESDREKKPWNWQMKAVFEPTDGFRMWNVDYSQLELRLMAAFAGVPSLKQVFIEERDIFDEMAEALGYPRQTIKTFVYANSYGAGDKKIARSIGITLAEAKKLRSDYLAEYPQLGLFSRKLETMAKRNKKIPMWSGRFRHMPYPSEAYKAMNSFIQGGGADIVERAMVRIAEEVCDENCYLLMQIHDAFVFEIKDGFEEEYLPRIVDIMCDVDSLIAEQMPSGLGTTIAVDGDEWPVFEWPEERKPNEY